MEVNSKLIQNQVHQEAMINQLMATVNAMSASTPHKSTTKYCHLHGPNNSHNGTECKKMGSPGFTILGKAITQAMINNRVPGKVVDGVTGKKWCEGGDSKLDNYDLSSYPYPNCNNLNYYSHITNTNKNSLPPILDCGAEETSIPENSVPANALQIKHVPTVAMYPNGNTTISSAASRCCWRLSGSRISNSKREISLYRPLHFL